MWLGGLFWTMDDKIYMQQIAGTLIAGYMPIYNHYASHSESCSNQDFQSLQELKDEIKAQEKEHFFVTETSGGFSSKFLALGSGTLETSESIGVYVFFSEIHPITRKTLSRQQTGKKTKVLLEAAASAVAPAESGM